MWVVEFEDTRRGTIIRTHEGRDFPATGRFWIEPDTGTVMMTELIMDRGSVRALIDVSYESEPLLGFRVPVEMREYFQVWATEMTGTAKYGRFRTFGVTADHLVRE